MKPDERKPATDEAKTLLRVAARDCKTFELLRDIAEAPFSSICFHAQQAVEKWLKAVLVSHGVVFGRTHDLEELAGLLTGQDIPLPLPVGELRRLNPFAVTFRYGDEDITRISREEVTRIVEAVSHWVEERLT